MIGQLFHTMIVASIDIRVVIMTHQNCTSWKVLETALSHLERLQNGTGDKDKKSVNGTQISTEKFPLGKRDYLSRNSIYSGSFQWNGPKSHVPFTFQPEIPGFFQLVNGNHSVFTSGNIH